MNHQRLYLPFDNPRWRLELGLKPLKLEDWTEVQTYCCSFRECRQTTQQYKGINTTREGLIDYLAGLSQG